jgi:ankyrin repeat protein
MANVNIQDGYYNNALQAASIREGKAVIVLLLKKGAHANSQGRKCNNVLQAALYKRHEEILQQLL